MNNESTQTGARQEWAAAPLSDLVQHILDTHHAYLREVLPRVTQLAAAGGAEQSTGGDLQETILGLRSELESHMWKEEMVLFPLIRALEAADTEGRPAPPSHCGSVQNPVRVMVHEHQEAKSALAHLRELTGGYAGPDGGGEPPRLFSELAQLDSDLHRHIHLEDDILFPRAVDLEARLCG